MRYAIWNDFLSVDVESIERPRDEAEVCAVIARARRQGKHVKPIGAGHSFNDLSLNEDILVDLRELSRILELDPETRTVRVQGGMPLHDLVFALERAGLALANIGAWTEQTIAGVISTATHGTSGRYRKTLIESVRALRIVDGTGEARVLEGEALRRITLGYFGIITEVTLVCEPLFFVRQHKRVIDGADAIARVDEFTSASDFVDLRWTGTRSKIIVGAWEITEETPTRRDRVARRLEGIRIGALNRLLAVIRTSAIPRRARARFFGALGRAYVRFGRGFAHEAVWHDGLTFNSLGVAAPHEERELALPRERAADCLTAARAMMMEDPASASLEIHVRFSPAIDVELAPNHQRETVWFNINALDPSGNPAIVDRLCSLALEHGARPHWAKVIPADTPALAKLYGESLTRWEEARRAFDPDGLFLNDYYHRYIDLSPRSLPEWAERE
ncbi:MAG: FAD-binding protein [Myxococcales bacterium]|nr:FAD-binding protein [Myxococcales bacterium]MCB9751419.1 FAD-binding protein [Myxococcales bacterium]